jgi:hypothetical protein
MTLVGAEGWRLTSTAESLSYDFHCIDNYDNVFFLAFIGSNCCRNSIFDVESVAYCIIIQRRIRLNVNSFFEDNDVFFHCALRLSDIIRNSLS